MLSNQEVALVQPRKQEVTFVSIAVSANPFHPNALDILFWHGKTRSTSVTFAHLSNHQQQRAVGDLGEGSRSVEEARFRPDSGTEENARIVVEKKHPSTKCTLSTPTRSSIT